MMRKKVDALRVRRLYALAALETNPELLSKRVLTAQWAVDARLEELDSLTLPRNDRVVRNGKNL
jgi:hypothetical protein